MNSEPRLDKMNGLNATWEPDLIVYHANCVDGFCAAFIASEVFPNAKLFPASYGGELPNVAGRHVLVVDFSWKREVTETLWNQAAKFLVIDHHKTAASELDGLPYVIFDMTRSGAGMVWDLLHPSAIRRSLVSYVEDADLWTWKLPDSKQVSAFLKIVPKTIQSWRELFDTPLSQLVEAGTVLQMGVEAYANEMIEQRRMGWIHTEHASHSVAVVNAPYPNVSQLGHALLPHADVALLWFQRADGKVQFSLRSENDVDVSALAQSYGGGGHKHAAGFELPLGQAMGLIEVLTQAMPPCPA